PPRHLPPPSPTLFPYTTLFRSETFFRGKLTRPQQVAILEQVRSLAWGIVALPCPYRPSLHVDELSLGREQGSNQGVPRRGLRFVDRKSTRLNSSHLVISYAVFC